MSPLDLADNEKFSTTIWAVLSRSIAVSKTLLIGILETYRAYIHETKFQLQMSCRYTRHHQCSLSCSQNIWYIIIMTN